MTNIRTVVGSMALDDLLSHRDEINERLLRVMDAAASPWGVKVTRIEIKDILPPADLAGAMARQMKAEREKRAAVLEAEGLRQAAILKAEGEKQSQILAAEGRKEAAFRDAEARERLAEAEAKATTMVSEAIARGDLAAANFLVAEKYIEAVKALATAPNQKVLIIPTELGGDRRHARRHRRDHARGVRRGPAQAGRRGRAAACRRRPRPEAAAMMSSCFSSLGPWAWIVLGLALMGLELLAPGVFLLWLGLAALADRTARLGLRPLLAGGGDQLRDPVRRLGAARPDGNAPSGRGGRGPVSAQPPRPCPRRPDLHARDADHRRQRPHPRRRFVLARHRPERARGRAGACRAGRRCDVGGGGGLVQSGAALPVPHPEARA